MGVILLVPETSHQTQAESPSHRHSCTNREAHRVFCQLTFIQVQIETCFVLFFFFICFPDEKHPVSFFYFKIYLCM